MKLNRARSLNNRFVVEPYKKEALRANIQNGFAKLDQKLAIKGLKTLLAAKLSDGTFVPKGSTVYVREEALHTQQWAQKVLESDGVGVPFIIVEASNVEFVVPSEGSLEEKEES